MPPGYLTRFAQQNRKKLTPAEAALWRALRKKGMGIRCKRQRPIGPYIADFCFASVKLIVEVDGGYHLPEPQRNKDAIRTQVIEKQGYRVLRVTNSDVLLRLAETLATIQDCIQCRSNILSKRKKRAAKV